VLTGAERMILPHHRAAGEPVIFWNSSFTESR
jgi:hypothetical protein